MIVPREILCDDINAKVASLHVWNPSRSCALRIMFSIYSPSRRAWKFAWDGRIFILCFIIPKQLVPHKCKGVLPKKVCAMKISSSQRHGNL
jgi:hypothetical protein